MSAKERREQAAMGAITTMKRFVTFKAGLEIEFSKIQGRLGGGGGWGRLTLLLV